ncbi:low molecular weight protein-tyrosine-phosphatase [Halomonas sp. PAMB 3232]|uniref:low molecular weight protein-tyrosine-phosphatase n=1 Tax=Halomonas sp. PAMB 3232 TaxID=3075221 RepID=UPI002899912A|nr:low molecular weight protein-tyrosine-phosphatase [Halomonas sp. PAMB 3232]WNL40383.1 low molecular weight protein-tyrosine-phosphatase [Halomonas sp. PAMB 3232]
MTRVLFVCLGNICRSPSAEGVFRKALFDGGLSCDVEVDSCGIGDWHVGKAPDERAQKAALRRGVDIGGLKARTLRREDFDAFDYVLGMDRDNLDAIRAMAPDGCRARTGLFLEYSDAGETEVPDPYFGGEQGFEHVLDLIEAASHGLIRALRKR